MIDESATDIAGRARVSSMEPASAHVIASIDSQYGGTSVAIDRLCNAILRQGAPTTILTLSPGPPSPVGAVPVDYFEPSRHMPLASQLRSSAALRRGVDKAAREADILHTHGLWLMPNIYPGWASATYGTPMVVSLHGMLGPAALRYSRLKKHVFWHFLQGDVVRASACVHATSTQELEEARAFGLKNPIAVIANGVDLPELPLDREDEVRTVLSLGRLHPKKGLDRLIEAWARIEAHHPAWRLRIVGRSENGHGDDLRRIVRRENLARVTIEDAIFGDDKAHAYRQAELFVLATLNENFALTVAEALASATPVISTKGAPWSGLQTHDCGWWIDHGIEPMTAALSHAMSLPREELKRMGANGRAWMGQQFSWESAASETLSVYRWLAGRGDMPSCVTVR